jgi:hypothetical protein
VVQNIIDAITGWMPIWAQHTVEILIYMAILAGLAATPLILWFVWVSAFQTRKRSASTT